MPLSNNHDIHCWPKLQPAPGLDPKLEQQIEQQLNALSLEQKVAQMIQPEIRFISEQQMQQYGFGSYLNGGGSYPNNDKHAKPEDWLEVADRYYHAAIASDAGIPTMWGTDAVHGHNNVIGATIFPHNIGLGACHHPELIQAIGQATAKEVLATGIEWLFAPTVAVVRDNRWGRTYESYSESPELVRRYAKAMVEGIQGVAADVEGDFFNAEKCIACAKHFIGDGGTEHGIDQGNNLSDEQALYHLHGQGYASAIEAGVQTIMASFNCWHGDKLHGHQYLLTEVLKQRMGFDGLIVGDWNGHAQVPGCRNDSCAAVINAGVDIIMVPQHWQGLFDNTVEQVRNGEIELARIDDAVRRILRVKYRAGVMDAPPPSKRPLAAKQELIGDESHRAIARQAVRESLVLLKDNDHLLPIQPRQHVLITGNAANDIARQCGGWSVTWQGTDNSNDDFPGATAIGAGLAEAIGAQQGTSELSTDGSFQRRPDLAVVVFGEIPYAEGVGDIEHIEYDYQHKDDLKLLQSLKSQGIPVVAVFVTGRPLWINKELNAADAFVVAWLPGSEGAGVADVLVADAAGRIRYDFQGKLSFSWPRTDDQLVLNREDSHYDPLFEYGFGLSYQEHDRTLAPLPEQNSLPYPKPSADLLIFHRVPGENMHLQLESAQQQELVVSSTQQLGEVLAIHTVDWQVQEDALGLQWFGGQQAAFAIAGHARNLTTFADNDAELVFMIRVVEQPSEPLLLTMTAPNDQVTKAVDIKAMLSGDGQWQQLKVALSSLSQAGFSWTQVTNKFVLSCAGKAHIELADIRLCPPAT
ncbi:glycoside hydrolase family 3 C-terminal domain-containing protein [Neiella sp. HB171785]|uniref:Glycoside hydrolase family 3 C-terminal domain-containing protein n=1 Tax=Neiella litorisoli TaxID=2771431 RepID=A0A8J6UGN3_9GAMM|nr:glycoside hydrolase family 3 N-terminal domain-containing protein [Neiella litorisoli]MBD1390436.1 glycoside hydrolase family 3 C-terminal domain-containing protein [Neiella litorisoli]